MDYFFSPPPSPLPNGATNGGGGSGGGISPFSQLSSNKVPLSPTRVQSPPQMAVLVEEDEDEPEEEEEEKEEKEGKVTMEKEEEMDGRKGGGGGRGQREKKRGEDGGKPANLKLFPQSSSVGVINENYGGHDGEEEEKQKQALVEEQALRLFNTCDKDSKGFIVRSDLDHLQDLVSVQQFSQLEHAFDLADHFRVNLVYEKDFLAEIKTLLLCPNRMSISKRKMGNNGIGEFRNISLDTDTDRKCSSEEEWSPTQKLTIAINSGGLNENGGGGLAALRRDGEDEAALSSMGYLGGLSPGSQPSEYWHGGAGRRTTGSHSPSTHSGISLHDELLSTTTNAAAPAGHHHSLANQQQQYDRMNGISAHVLMREMQSPGSTCSEPIPLREADFVQQLFNRRTTCGNTPVIGRENSIDQGICPERIFKVVFVGDSAVGKTCFLHRFCHNRFKPLFSATIGVDFTVKTLSVRDRLVALQLWDTAGQERFRSITKQYFRKADGVVLMYDVTSETSFINVRNWIESVRVGVDDGCVLCLVGNKVDLYPNEHCRTITYQHGHDLAQEFDMLFFETSAFNGQGIEECMQALALRLQIREDEHMDELIKLEAMIGGGKRSWCCV